MIYQLPNGKAIEISVEQYLDMTDQELAGLNAYPVGENIEDPWFGSVLSKLPPPDVELDDIIIEDLTDISLEEKLINPDIDLPYQED